MANKVVLRERFSFLTAPDCPDEFKILVSDMITAHSNYMGAHAHLYAVVAKDEKACFEAARNVVENRLNNVAIWKELEHYQKTGKVLGAHPIFKDRMRQVELREMTHEDLKKEREKNRRSLAYYNKLLKERKTDDRRKEWQDFIAEREKERKIIHQILGLTNAGRKRKGANHKRTASKKSRGR